jgi:hypothetical protein
MAGINGIDSISKEYGMEHIRKSLQSIREDKQRTLNMQTSTSNRVSKQSESV